MMSYPILIPMFVHVIWVAILYAALTLFRAPNVWGLGKNLDASGSFGNLERKVSANLSNQFEWPILFYVICLLIISTGANHFLFIWLAWLFVVGRFLHTFVQVFTGNIRLRGIVFTINFIAVLAMWCIFVQGNIT